MLSHALFTRCASGGVRVQVELSGTVSAILIVCSALTLVRGVHERTDSEVAEATPFVASIRDLLNNGPYTNYLMIKFALAFAGGLQSAAYLYYIKYYLKYEVRALLRAHTRAQHTHAL
jgi:Na+/melibiose symporter-like transporter|eukprot:6374370-Prymnesium_polylepis.2